MSQVAHDIRLETLEINTVRDIMNGLLENLLKIIFVLLNLRRLHHCINVCLLAPSNSYLAIGLNQAYKFFS